MRSIFANQREEYIQRCAWRLVRSSEDRIKSIAGSGRGSERLIWAVTRLQEEFPELKDRAEDYIRAAFFHFKIEMSSLERRIV